MTWSWGGCVLGVKGVDDVLAGVELGVVFLGVKGVDDVLAGRGAGFDLLVSRALMTCLLVWSLMAVFMAIRRLMGFLGLFRVPPVVPE